MRTEERKYSEQYFKSVRNRQDESVHGEAESRHLLGPGAPLSPGLSIKQAKANILEIWGISRLLLHSYISTLSSSYIQSCCVVNLSRCIGE